VKKVETMYKKVGRKYVPVGIRWYEDHNCSGSMNVGTFLLTYAYTEGGRMYEYSVKPDTASFIAASMVARKAMEEKITEFAKAKPSGTKKYTDKQLAAIAEFREKMGGMFPTWWIENSSYDIAKAGIDAVINYKP